jgi:hypothetical protein
MTEHALPRVHRIGAHDRLVSIHIPKTAGTTLNTLIDPLWLPQERFPLYNRHELQGVIPESLDKYRSFSGHFNVSEIEYLLASPFICITMLREPTARYLSNFLHIKYKPPFQARPIVERELPVVREMSIDEFVTRNDLFIPRDISNLQTRILGAPLDPATLPASRTEPYYGKLDREAMSVQTAKEKLASMTAFGLTERFQDSLDLLAYTFGWKPMQATQVLNPREAAAEREIVTEGARARMREMNAMDVELYEFAVELFEQRMREMTASLVERYESRNKQEFNYPLERYVLAELLEKHHVSQAQTLS